jgi:hypothetical protein
MLLLDTEIERSPRSEFHWLVKYRIGYRVGRKRTNKNGLCSRLQGFIPIDTIAPGKVQTATDPSASPTARDAGDDTGTETKKKNKEVLGGLCVPAVALWFPE